MYKMPGILGALVCAAAIFSPTCALADKTISTVSDWDGATYVDPFGYPNAATFGQSFTAPIYNHTMTSFTFYLEPIMSGSDVGFTAYIYQWDKSTDTAVGSPVFTSSQLSTAGMAADEYSAVTINTGDLDLIPNGKYIAFFSASGTDTGNVTDPVNVGFLGHDFDGIDDYDGGGFFYLDNGSDTSQFTSGPWLDEVGHGKDSLAFSMTFTEGSITTADLHAASELSVTDEFEPGPWSSRIGRIARCPNSAGGKSDAARRAACRPLLGLGRRRSNRRRHYQHATAGLPHRSHFGPARRRSVLTWSDLGRWLDSRASGDWGPPRSSRILSAGRLRRICSKVQHHRLSVHHGL